MNIEKGIQTRWPTISALEALLPVARVFTGRAPAGTVKPYASIMVASMPTAGRSDKGMYRDPDVRFQVWSDTYAVGKAIQDAITDGFENADFALDDGVVNDMRQVDATGLQEGEAVDDVWQFVSIFSAGSREDRVL